ncbi:DUF5668 domain-containing protein [Sphingobacterium sp. SRCM116780]|uniref:LiaI-LiaF-like domain-containing protein n=1 Tax=Sphingobacterium sp. SRCM116780 TaxID=2907623 RepID=UPI001F1843A3|nr:DUF5668 domain-containing protein [Sphingobacterium sp. SRCM116780]UIR55084.1 DUF5668 domain-containing protein [Sphingobacterium sp. SRCM116780]
MDAKRITTGIIFLFIGVVLLLSKMDVIEFNWFEVIRYWPLLIILLGVNVLVPKKDIGYIISIGTTCVILGIFTFIGLTTPNQSLLSRIINSRSTVNTNTDDEDDFKDASHFVFAKNTPNTTRATANIDLGATALILKDSTATNLFEANNSAEMAFLSLSTVIDDEHETTINLKGKTKKNLDSKDNRTIIKLNKNVEWDLNFDVGAIDINADLSPFKIRNLSFDTGASSTKLKLGNPLQDSKIAIDAGASSMEIYIPKGVACQLISEMALSSIDVDDSFHKDDETGHYTTANYHNATAKYDITIDAGITSVSIRRY